MVTFSITEKYFETQVANIFNRDSSLVGNTEIGDSMSERAGKKHLWIGIGGSGYEAIEI